MLPASALSERLGTGTLIVPASAAMVVAICCASSRSPMLRVCGGLLGGVLALVLIPLNGTIPLWEGLMLLAVMFLGTAVHRAEHRQTTWWCAASTAVVVVTCAMASAYRYGDGTISPGAAGSWPSCWPCSPSAPGRRRAAGTCLAG